MSNSLTTENGFMSHPYIQRKSLESRQYQIDLFDEIQEENSLLSLPTGLGKTNIGILTTAEMLDRHGVNTYPRTVMVAPSKPLVQQHKEAFEEFLNTDKIRRESDVDTVVRQLTGDTSQKDREDMWKDSTVIIATPQVVRNDILQDRTNLSTVKHLIVDESHKAVGNYSFVFVANFFADNANGIITAMSASPGETKEEIRELCTNINITNIAFKTENDPSVNKYTEEKKIDWEPVTLPDDIMQAIELIENIIEVRVKKLNKMGMTNKRSSNITKGDVFDIRDAALEKKNSSGNNAKAYTGLSYYTELMNLVDMKRILESQGTKPFLEYVERQKQKSKENDTKATQRLLSESHIKKAISIIEEYDDTYPKLKRLRQKIARNIEFEDAERVLVFTERRDTVERIVSHLDENFNVDRLVGQSDTQSSAGMTQQEQREAIKRLENKEINILVSTSVGEEGLDIPAVDIVLFFEPVVNAIQSVQRKGRTGRETSGKVMILYSENTDEKSMKYISQSKEESMEEELVEIAEYGSEIEEELQKTDDEEMKKENTDENKDRSIDDSVDIGDSSMSLYDFADGNKEDKEDSTGEKSDRQENNPNEGESITKEENTTEVIVDNRELRSIVPEEIKKSPDVSMSTEQLPIGDYIISDKVAVERKTVDDFFDTLFNRDKGLFEQVGELTEEYEDTILLIEGKNLFNKANVNDSAILGALSSLTTDIDANVVQVDNGKQTARFLITLAKREQEEKDRSTQIHGNKTGKTEFEQKRYIVASLPGIDKRLSERLLDSDEFDSVSDVFNATKENLQSVEGIGKKKAESIVNILQ